LQTNLAFLIYGYTEVFDSAEKKKIISLLMALTLGILTNKALSNVVRNAMLDEIFKICQTDKEIFKFYLASEAS